MSDIKRCAQCARPIRDSQTDTMAGDDSGPFCVSCYPLMEGVWQQTRQAHALDEICEILRLINRDQG